MTREEKIKRCAVTFLGNGRWEVASPSGATYEVRVRTKMDECGSLYFTTDCTCPARAQCVHIEAVDRVRYFDKDSVHVMERS